MVILIFALTIGVIAHRQTLKVVESEGKNATMGLLKQSKEILNMRLSEIESIVKQIEDDPKVLAFNRIQNPYVGSNTYKIIDTKNNLYAHQLTNQFIFDYFLFFKNSKIALNNNLVTTLPDFYKYTLQPANLKYNDWYKEIIESYHQKHIIPARPFLYKDKQFSFITYLHSLGLPTHFNSTIMIMINNDELINLLQEVDISGGGSVYITDENNNIITYVSDDGKVNSIISGLEEGEGVVERTFQDENMIVSYTTSDYNGWKYVAVQPVSVFMEKVNYINKITISIIILAFIAGLLIAIYMANRNAKPVTTLFSQHDELQKKLRDQIPLLKNAFFERILKGEFTTKYEINLFMNHIGINLKGKQYVVAIMYLSGPDEITDSDMLRKSDVNRVIAKDVLNNIMGNEAFYHELDENKIAIIVADNNSGSLKFKDILIGLYQQVHQELMFVHHIQPIFAIGSTYRNIIDISRSYDEARIALNFYNRGYSNGFIWYEDITKEENSFYYPSDVESRLINSIKVGNEQNTEELLAELYKENFENRQLSIYMLRMFLYEMWGSIVKILDQVVLDEKISIEYEQFLPDKTETVEEVKTNFYEVVQSYKKICAAINIQRSKNNKRLINDIINYLKENYKNVNLSLSLISDKFNLSEAHVSRIFKENTGMNFSEFMESSRLEKAEEMLINTDLPVGEISKLVGYNSSNTFGRAFKRKNGISATAYRNSVKIS